MEERWLSRKRYAPASDIRDYIRVHGKVVKLRPAANQAKSSSPSKPSKRQTTITNRRKARGWSTAFAYTTGVRKKVHVPVVSDNLDDTVVPTYTQRVENGVTQLCTEHSRPTTNEGVIATKAAERSLYGETVDVVELAPCKEHSDTRDAVSVDGDHRPHEDLDATAGEPSTLETMNSTDLYSHTCTLSSEGMSDIESIDPNLIDTEALLKELSDYSIHYPC